MNLSQHDYILQNFGKKSVKEIALDLGIKQQKVKACIEKELDARKQKKFENIPMAVFSRADIKYLAGLIISGFLIYSNTFHSSFHFDDMDGIVNNTFIRDLGAVKTIWDAFGTRFVFGLTLAMNYAMAGLNVVVYHATSLAAHIFSAICLYFFISLTIQTSRLEEQKILRAYSSWVAFFSALLFLVHPLQTQAVNYIWQRSTCLATLFYLLSMLLYAKFRLGSKISYVLLFPSIILAMYSKEISFTLPVAICAYEYFFFSAAPAEDLKKRAKYLLPVLLTLAIIPLTFYLHTSHVILNVMRPDTLSSGSSSLDITRFVSESVMSRKQYFLSQINVLRTYLRLLVFPVNLNLDYDYPLSNSLFEIKTFASFLLLLLISCTGVWAHRKNRYLSFSILWIFLTMSIESLVVQKDVIFEHRLYLPMVGFCMLVPAAVFSVSKSFRISLAILLSISMIFGVMTFQRNRIWFNEETLWRDVVSKSPNKSGGYHCLALFYQLKKDNAPAIQYYQKAIELGRESSKKNSTVLGSSYLNLGLLYFNKGNIQGAINNYLEALKISPDDPHAYLDLGVAYGSKGETDKEIEHYKKAIQLDAMYSVAYNNLGAVYLDRGDLTQAIPLFEKAIKIDPVYLESIYSLGLAYMKKGDLDSARIQLEKIEKLGNIEMANRLRDELNTAAISHE